MKNTLLALSIAVAMTGLFTQCQSSGNKVAEYFSFRIEAFLPVITPHIICSCLACIYKLFGIIQRRITFHC